MDELFTFLDSSDLFSGVNNLGIFENLLDCLSNILHALVGPIGLSGRQSFIIGRLHHSELSLINRSLNHNPISSRHDYKKIN